MRLIRRNRIYASPDALMQGIAKVRQAGPASPPLGMFHRVKVKQSEFEGREVYTVSPTHQRPSLNQVLYLHGGAYVRPITRHHWRLIEDLVKRTGCTVIVPLYPLAPESTCEDTLGFLLRLHEKLREGQPNQRMSLMGDSAGGGLSVALALALRDQGAPSPAQLTLISPWVDVACNNPMMAHTALRDPMLALDGAREAGRLYAGKLPLDHPWVSPLHADLSGLPPMTVFVGTRDIVHHDAIDLADKASIQGCKVDLRITRGMIHAWPLLPIPEGHRARAEIANVTVRVGAQRPLTDPAPKAIQDDVSA